MADNETKRPKLNEQQKMEVRTLMNEYRQSHQGAELKEVLTYLDVPYRDQITVGVLRGLVPRKANGRPSTRSGNGKAGAAKRASGQPTKRLGSLEKVLEKLARLRQEQAELEQQIEQVETELRQRLQTELGEGEAKRIFAS
jgi:hypothetical protein